MPKCPACQSWLPAWTVVFSKNLVCPGCQEQLEADRSTLFFPLWAAIFAGILTGQFLADLMCLPLRGVALVTVYLAVFLPLSAWRLQYQLKPLPTPKPNEAKHD